MEATQRMQVTLPLSTIAALKALGHGRLSAGILVLAAAQATKSAASPAATPAKPLTVAQHKDVSRREHMRSRMIETFRRAAETRVIDPLELEALDLGITMDDIVPAPVAEPVDDDLAGWCD